MVDKRGEDDVVDGFDFIGAIEVKDVAMEVLDVDGDKGAGMIAPLDAGELMDLLDEHVLRIEIDRLREEVVDRLHLGGDLDHLVVGVDETEYPSKE
jgi:hypothetical protein